jgi:hypothetical protein
VITAFRAALVPELPPTPSATPNAPRVLVMVLKMFTAAPVLGLKPQAKPEKLRRS